MPTSTITHHPSSIIHHPSSVIRHLRLHHLPHHHHHHLPLSTIIYAARHSSAVATDICIE
jgi:hypothetical protein